MAVQPCLVGNPEDRFYQFTADLSLTLQVSRSSLDLFTNRFQQKSEGRNSTKFEIAVDEALKVCTSACSEKQIRWLYDLIKPMIMVQFMSDKSGLKTSSL